VRTEAGFSWKSYAGLAASLIVPSLSLFSKLNPFFLALYIGLSASLLIVLVKYIYPYFQKRISQTQANVLALITLAVIAVMFAIIYPRIDTAGFSIFGIRVGAADTDNGLQTATELMLKGKYPYYGQIFSGLPISQLPGELILAAPFLLLRYAAVQNLFWLAIFFILIKGLFKDSRPALVLLWTLITLSPIILVQLMTGVDYPANSLFVLTFLLLLKNAEERHAPPYQKYLFAVLLGLGLSSRVNFILLLPVIFFAVARLSGLLEAVKTTAVSFLSFLLVTLPFYLYDPRGFAPLYTLHTLQFPGLFKYGHLIFPFFAGVLSILLGLLKNNSGTSTFLKNCALVQAILVLGAVVGCLVQPDPSLRRIYYMLGYGVFFMFFGVLGFGMDIFKRDSGI